VRSDDDTSAKRIGERRECGDATAHGGASSVRDAQPVRFAADGMLGRLAKDLRMLGYDVAYDPFVEDRELIRQARAENRVLLTRDTGILRRRDLPSHLFVQSDHVGEQLTQVASEFGFKLDRRAAFTRCMVCNTELEEATRETVRDEVPPYVYATQPQFARCPGCGRIYWRGTHVEHMKRKLETLGADE
jgi:uncharacterized protein with PIN domain